MTDDVNKGGAPEGNTNAKRGTAARDSLRRSLCRVGMKFKVDYQEEHNKPFPNEDELTNYEIGLDAVSHGMLLGGKGSRETFREVADRTDGKAVLAIEMSTPDGPIGVVYKMEFPENGDDPAPDAA